METLNESLVNLPEDGICYAHFFSHPDRPNYYGIWVLERTPEYMKLWLPQSQIADFKLAFSLEMPDTEFRDYMLQRYTEHIRVNFLKLMCRLEDINNPQIWVYGFKAWKQEKILNERTKWLEQYQNQMSARIQKVK